MRTWLLATCLAWVILATVAIEAYGGTGKITVDPNVVSARKSENQPASKSENQLDVTADHRLATKVTYEARRQPLRAILSDLAKKTGVELKAGVNGKDWQVRDRRMNIFANDVTLAHSSLH